MTQSPFQIRCKGAAADLAAPTRPAADATPVSCRHLREDEVPDADPDADPDTKEDHHAAARAAVTSASTPDSGGRQEAVSTAAGAVGRRH